MHACMHTCMHAFFVDWQVCWLCPCVFRWWRTSQSFINRLTQTTRTPNNQRWRRPSASSTLEWEHTPGHLLCNLFPYFEAEHMALLDDCLTCVGYLSPPPLAARLLRSNGNSDRCCQRYLPQAGGAAGPHHQGKADCNKREMTSHITSCTFLLKHFKISILWKVTVNSNKLGDLY